MLANRSGKTESEILQEEVAKEKLKVQTSLHAALACTSAHHQHICCAHAYCGTLTAVFYSRQLRLTPEQAQEKEGIETQLTELKEAISLEESDEKKATLQEELTAGQEKLDALMDSVRVRSASEQCHCSHLSPVLSRAIACRQNICKYLEALQLQWVAASA